MQRSFCLTSCTLKRCGVVGLPAALFKPHWEQKAGAVFSTGIGGRGLSSSPALAPPAPPPGKLLHCYSTYPLDLWCLLSVCTHTPSLSLSVCVCVLWFHSVGDSLWYGNSRSSFESNLQMVATLSQLGDLRFSLEATASTPFSMCIMHCLLIHHSDYSKEQSVSGGGGKSFNTRLITASISALHCSHVGFPSEGWFDVLCVWVSKDWWCLN